MGKKVGEGGSWKEWVDSDMEGKDHECRREVSVHREPKKNKSTANLPSLCFGEIRCVLKKQSRGVKR